MADIAFKAVRFSKISPQNHHTLPRSNRCVGTPPELSPHAAYEAWEVVFFCAHHPCVGYFVDFDWIDFFTKKYNKLIDAPP